MSGALEKEAFMRLRTLVNQHVMLEFKEKKEELMNKRIEAYKQRNDQAYAQFISEASQQYMALLQTRTRDSIEFLNVSEANYRVTLNEIT